MSAPKVCINPAASEAGFKVAFCDHCNAKPTDQQIALAKFADEAEASGLKTSAYYRLWDHIVAARAAIAKVGGI